MSYKLILPLFLPLFLSACYQPISKSQEGDVPTALPSSHVNAEPEIEVIHTDSYPSNMSGQNCVPYFGYPGMYHGYQKCPE